MTPAALAKLPMVRYSRLVPILLDSVHDYGSNVTLFIQDSKGATCRKKTQGACRLSAVSLPPLPLPYAALAHLCWSCSASVALGSPISPYWSHSGPAAAGPPAGPGAAPGGGAAGPQPPQARRA